MPNKLLEQAIQEIADDETLTASEKLRKQADVMRDFRSLTGEADRVIGRKDKTSIGGTFFRSMARTAGRNIIKAFFK